MSSIIAASRVDGGIENKPAKPKRRKPSHSRRAPGVSEGGPLQLTGAMFGNGRLVLKHRANAMLEMIGLDADDQEAVAAVVRANVGALTGSTVIGTSVIRDFVPVSDHRRFGQRGRGKRSLILGT